MGYYTRSAGASGVGVVLGIILAAAATVLACIFLLPEKRREGMKNKFMEFLHDFVNFKVLFIDKLMKVLYIFTTCAAVLVGFFMLILGGRYLWYVGLMLMVFGPIVIRLVYEGMMLLIIGVNNIVEINNKLSRRHKHGCKGEEKKCDAPAPAPEPEMVFCMQCGTRYDKNQGSCPNCGNKNEL